jgi:hypothetical protein
MSGDDEKITYSPGVQRAPSYLFGDIRPQGQSS